MIQLIVGHKGSGKTKAIVEMANKAVKESKGYVVVIEKDVRLTYEISSAARLVYSDEYAIAGYDAVYGFITGLLAETAASASALTNWPTMIESVTLYSWVTMAPSRMGRVKTIRFLKIGPSVRSIRLFPSEKWRCTAGQLLSMKTFKT